MIKSSIEKLAEHIGYDIGMSDDQTQAKLLNGFAKALYNSMPDNDKVGTQICYIVDSLDSKADEIFLEMAEFIKCKQQNPKNKI